MASENSVNDFKSDLVFSHFGFFVTDISKIASFYKKALLFTQTDAGQLGETRIVFLSRSPNDHHQIVLMSGRPEGLQFNVINQISLKVPDLPALRKYRARLVAEGALDVQPVTHGNAISIYCKDPEGNRLELYLDTNWYCEQPLRVALDFTKSDEEILAESDAMARKSNNFQTRSAWKEKIALKMKLDQSSET